MLLHALFPLLHGVVAVDRQNLKLALVLVVVFLHLWYAAHAPDAPRAPEVEQHVFALEAGERERLAVDVVEREVRSHGASRLLLSSLSLGLLACLQLVYGVLVVSVHASVSHLLRQRCRRFLHRGQVAQRRDECRRAFRVRMLGNEVHYGVYGLLLQRGALLAVFFLQCLLRLTCLHALVQRLHQLVERLEGVRVNPVSLIVFLVELAAAEEVFLAHVAGHHGLLARHGNSLEPYALSAAQRARGISVYQCRLVHVDGELELAVFSEHRVSCHASSTCWCHHDERVFQACQLA